MYGIIIFMDWSLKRKIIYGVAISVLCTAVVFFVFRDTLFPKPTCFDRAMNGFETGIDCGGACSLRCEEDVIPLTVLWSKAIRVSENLYDLVGMVSNKNIDNASPALGYSFTLYDSNRSVMRTISGTTTAPIDGNFPIVVQNVPLQQKAAEVSLQLHDTRHYSVLEKPSSPTIKILNRRYENGLTPRVYATIQNTKQKALLKLPVYVLLFDADDNVYASGGTVMPVVDRESVQEIVFTWNEPFSFPPTRIGIYPLFNPFQGTR